MTCLLPAYFYGCQVYEIHDNFMVELRLSLAGLFPGLRTKYQLPVASLSLHP